MIGAGLITALDELASALLAAFPAPVVVAEGSAQGNLRSLFVPCPVCKTAQKPGAVHFATVADVRPCAGSWRGR